MEENSITYTHTNTYTTLNDVTSQTKNVWVALHGMGYLSKYFIKYFKALDTKENYIIAPQAPSKYYQDKRFKYIGASWLTRENIEVEKHNLYAYLDAMWSTELEKIGNQEVRFIFMGYSQGVSILTRWMAHRALSCDYLLLHSGAIPLELEATDFNYLPQSTTVTYLYGDEDEYITEARKTEQQLKGKALFGERLNVQVFKGKHEVHVPFINEISKELK